MKPDCPFCSPGIRDQIFLEKANILAVYNIAPILPGHSMVIPRRHVESVFELSDEEVHALFGFARIVTQILMKVFSADGYDWSLQESEAAGQSVAHLHLHIIPRKPYDLKHPGDWYAKLEDHRNARIDSPGRKQLGKQEIESVIALIKKHIP